MNDVTILVVDDDDDVRNALLDELSPEYAVTAASCGEEAFAALSARRYDVVISDLRMPDHDGIEVLDFARGQDAGIIRILLTGYVDDRAHEALLEPDAPYKVGKPWYDEIEIVLRRALEQRRRARTMAATLSTAFGLTQLDAVFAAAGDVRELAELLAVRVAMIEGVHGCASLLDGTVVAGTLPAEEGDGWRRSVTVDGDGRLVLVVRGGADETWALVAHVVHLAQKRSGVLTPPVVSPRRDPKRPSPIDVLVRHATLGTMVASLLHDVAGIMQGIECAALELRAISESRQDGELVATLDDLSASGHQAIELFVAMRRFLREGTPPLRTFAVDDAMNRAMAQVGALARQRATVRVTPSAGVSVLGCEPLLVQSIAAVISNAAAVSPPGGAGAIDVEVRVADDRVQITVVDDGPGVSPEVADVMFEPHSWQRPVGAGTSLAVAAHALSAQGGTIDYRRAPGRGACFTLTLPVASGS